MRIKKVPHESFETMVRATGKFCKFIKVPSSNGKNFFTGILMSNDVWIAWPENLTEDEMKYYISLYGEPPDIFTPKEKIEFSFKEAEKERIKRENQDERTPQPSE